MLSGSLEATAGRGRVIGLSPYSSIHLSDVRQSAIVPEEFPPGSYRYSYSPIRAYDYPLVGRNLKKPCSGQRRTSYIPIGLYPYNQLPNHQVACKYIDRKNRADRSLS